MRMISALPRLADRAAWRSLAWTFAKSRDASVSVETAFAAIVFAMLNSGLIAAVRQFLDRASRPATVAVPIES